MASLKPLFEKMRKYTANKKIIFITAKQPYQEARRTYGPPAIFKGPIIIDYIGQLR